MNDEMLLLQETLEDALRAAHPPGWQQPESGELVTATWEMALDLGWDSVGLPEELGGFGDSVAPQVMVAQACGRHPIPMPLVETVVARTVLAMSGFAQPAERATLTVADGVLGTQVTVVDGHVQGCVHGVPWARHAEQAVLTGSDGAIALVDLAQGGVQVTPGTNLAGEGRDKVIFTGPPASRATGGEAARGAKLLGSRLSLLRAAQILGAMEQALAATREHTAARKQFGQPLNRFQLVGAHIAEMAAEVAFVAALLKDATHAHDVGSPEPATASLKLAADMAATTVARGGASVPWCDRRHS
jgi:alkylation response protein AidB-like acyl-CoA dehydrogenase